MKSEATEAAEVQAHVERAQAQLERAAAALARATQNAARTIGGRRVFAGKQAQRVWEALRQESEAALAVRQAQRELAAARKEGA